MDNSPNKKVASLVWDLNSGLHQAQADVIKELGYKHVFFKYAAKIPEDADIVFLQGPYGSLLPLVRQIVETPVEKRPILIYWFQQSLQILKPAWLNYIISSMFSDLQRYYGDIGLMWRILNSATAHFLVKKGTRLGYFGDLVWLSRKRIIDLLALSSTVYEDYLKQLGITSIVVPRGYHPSYGSIQTYPRTTAIVWMGKIRTKRRREAVFWLQDQMNKLGQELIVYDGYKNDLIFSEERTRILNQAWFVLNIFFSGPTDELSIRYFIAAANGAVVLTEPGSNRYPFIPGKHVVECTIEEMPGKVMHYLNHPDQWKKISQNMYNLITNELTLINSIRFILDQAEIQLSQRKAS